MACKRWSSISSASRPARYCSTSGVSSRSVTGSPCQHQFRSRRLRGSLGPAVAQRAEQLVDFVARADVLLECDVEQACIDVVVEIVEVFSHLAALFHIERVLELADDRERLREGP